MRYTEEQYNLSQKVSNVVCGFFGVKHKDLINKCKSEQLSNARFYIWYILHTKYGLSYTVISAMYFRTKRNVEIGIAKIKYGIKEQPFYRKIFEDICLLLD